MMINRQVQIHPTVEIPPWDPPYDDPTTDINLTNLIISPQTKAYFSALRQYLPSSAAAAAESCDSAAEDSEADEFRMYEFKVRRCSRARSHDWTECPYAHPGEKARRRDPRRWNYSASPCPEFRRGGGCRKGESCEFAHGVFECWLHPARYRTQPCNDGPLCRRRVCFFAHTPAELRRAHHSPPTSESDSPPQSPSYGGNSVAELIGAMQGFHVGSPVGPRISGPGFGLVGRVGYFGVGRVDPEEEEEVQMERVESGKGIRESMYAKLCKENSLDWGRVDSASSGVDFDFGWVSELVN